MRKTVAIFGSVIALACLALVGLRLVRKDRAAPVAAVPTTAAVVTVPAAAPSGKVKSFLAMVDRDDLSAVRSTLADDRRLATLAGGPNGETALHHVRSAEMATLLLDAGADPNARDTKYHARPIRWAVSDWHEAAAKVLATKAGIDDDIIFYVATGDIVKAEPLLAADPSLVKNKPSDPDALGSKGTLLHVAAHFGQARMCELLLHYGADIAAQGSWFDAQPLEVAGWAGYPEVVSILLKHGAPVNAVIHTDQGERTALWTAAATGRKQIVEMLLNAGATVDPALPDAVEQAMSQPYFGRALPPQQDYEAVLELLEKHSPVP